MQTTTYVWDVAARLPVILQAKTNGATTSYLYGLDLVSATDNNGVRTYLLQDGLGSTTGLTDGSGSVTDTTHQYDAFGSGGLRESGSRRCATAAGSSGALLRPHCCERDRH